MEKYFPSMYVCETCMCRPQRTEDVEFPRTGITESWAAQCADWELDLGRWKSSPQILSPETEASASEGRGRS